MPDRWQPSAALPQPEGPQRGHRGVAHRRMGAEGLDGVSVFSPVGKLIGRILLPERCANLCFGGLRRNRLFMAATTSLYALYVNAQGVPYF